MQCTHYHILMHTHTHTHTHIMNEWISMFIWETLTIDLIKSSIIHLFTLEHADNCIRQRQILYCIGVLVWLGKKQFYKNTLRYSANFICYHATSNDEHQPVY